MKQFVTSSQTGKVIDGLSDKAICAKAVNYLKDHKNIWLCGEANSLPDLTVCQFPMQRDF